MDAVRRWLARRLRPLIPTLAIESTPEADYSFRATVLREVLVTLKADRDPEPGELVFPSASGTARDRNRVRTRVLGKPITRADENLAAAKLTALPEGLTLHSLRRTFASLLIALGKDPAYVMRQAGHTDPTVTLGLYAKVMAVSDADLACLRTLVEGVDVVPSGSESDSEAPSPAVTVGT